MSEEQFHPRVDPTAAEADRRPTRRESYPEPDGPGSGPDSTALPADAPEALTRREPGAKHAEPRFDADIPLAQLRRALDSFYASTHVDPDQPGPAVQPGPTKLPKRSVPSSPPKPETPTVPPMRRAPSSSATPRAAETPSGRRGYDTPSKIPAAPGRPTRPPTIPSPRSANYTPAETIGWAAPGDASAPPTRSGGRNRASDSPVSAPISAPASTGPKPGRRRAIRISGRPSLRWWLTAGALALILAGTAAVFGMRLGGNNPAPAPPAAPARPPGVAGGPTASAAAAWVIQNVGAKHVVACDVAMCGLLLAEGFPSTSLVTVRTGISDVEQADVVVDTSLVRQMVGAALTTVESAQPLASFGAGGQAVTITAVALTGPAKYTQQLDADLVSRRQAGQALLDNPLLTLSSLARTQLADGSVDTRVCALLALLVGSHAISVLSFAPAGPGNGPGIPAAGVVISTIDGQPADGDSPAAPALKSLLDAQQPPYQPLSLTSAVVPGGAGAAQSTPGVPPSATGTAGTGTGTGTTAGTGLEILYAQPGPFGLLGGGSQ